jgi:hypothetical protein
MGEFIGCYYCNDPPGKYFQDQRNDPTEEEYRKLLLQLKVKYPEIHWGFLESCGVNAFANCLGATVRGRKIIDKLTVTLGTYENQIPHLFIGCLNDPINYAEMRRIRSNLDPRLIQGNRVPQYYELLARIYCGITAHFEWGCSFDKVKDILLRSNPVQVCQPGHYIAVTGYNPKSDMMRILNSNPKAGNGVEERTRQDFKTFENWLVWYEIQ